MKKLNNKGFAISTVIYGTFILFIMLLAILLASINSSLRLLEDRVNAVNNYEIGSDIEPPDLTTGLIPVVYDTKGEDTDWFVADTSAEWYSYEKQEWANAVLVKTSSKNKYIKNGETYIKDKEISLSDLLAMFVWIPRFSYTIGCHDTNNCYGYRLNNESDKNLGTPSQSSPGAIDIKFVDKDTNETYTGTYTYTSEADRNPTNYYTHPAFNFGNDKLSGIWVGKFETSTDVNASCYNSTTNDCAVGATEVRILPNVTSMRYQKVANQFAYSQYFTSNILYGLTGDSHMMKNNEWSAVAYLSQSIYGKYGNKDYSGGNKEIYINNYYNTSKDGYITGVSAGAPSTSSSSSITCRYNEEGDNRTKGTGLCGPGASTTGNIYGIYDMSGGAIEYVMGNYNASYDDSGFDASWLTTEGNLKYYDRINKKDYDEETLKGNALKETSSWYSDYCENINDLYWVSRGGFYNNDTKTGIFSWNMASGISNENYSFRVSLVKP